MITELVSRDRIQTQVFWLYAACPHVQCMSHTHWVMATTVMSLMTQFMKERKVVLPTITYYGRANCLRALVSLHKFCPCLPFTSWKLALKATSPHVGPCDHPNVQDMLISLEKGKIKVPWRKPDYQLLCQPGLQPIIQGLSRQKRFWRINKVVIGGHSISSMDFKPRAPSISSHGSGMESPCFTWLTSHLSPSAHPSGFCL